MRLIPFASLLLLATATGCGPARTLRARSAEPTARVALEVEKEALLAPGLADDLEAELRRELVRARVGIPVEAGSPADQVLKVTVTSANFTQATEWRWRLVGTDGSTLGAGRNTAAFGIATEDLANVIVGEILDLPTGGAAPAVATPERPVAPTEGGGNVAEKPNYYAVIVGIERYREDLAPATGAEADARAFAAFARRRLGVPEANTKVLVGDRATRADLAGALLEWLPRNAVEPGGTVYVYFSGHGAPDPTTGDAYLVPYDANPAYLKTGGLALAPLQASLAGLAGQRVFLFLDACFSGQGDRSVLAAGTRPLVPVRPLDAPAGLVTLAAAGAAETTGAHPDGGGLFTHHLLAALGGAADTDGDGRITVAEVRDHVVPAVRRDARRQNRDQTPSVAVPAGFDPGTPILLP